MTKAQIPMSKDCSNLKFQIAHPVFQGGSREKQFLGPRNKHGSNTDGGNVLGIPKARILFRVSSVFSPWPKFRPPRIADRAIFNFQCPKDASG